MSDSDIGVPALDASMADMEEAGGKFELSPENSGDARDTSTGSGLLFFMFIRPPPYTCLGIAWLTQGGVVYYFSCL